MNSLRQLGNLIRDVSEDRAEAAEEALQQVAEAMYGRATTESERTASGILKAVDANTKAFKKVILHPISDTRSRSVIVWS